MIDDEARQHEEEVDAEIAALKNLRMEVAAAEISGSEVGVAHHHRERGQCPARLKALDGFELRHYGAKPRDRRGHQQG